MEVFEDLLEACLAHLERYAAVAEETAAPDAQDRFTAVHTGGDDEAQESLHFGRSHVGPTLIAAKAFLVFLGVHVGLSHHILDRIVWYKQLEEVHGCGSGWHFLGRTCFRKLTELSQCVMAQKQVYSGL